jgi:DNA-binding Lrp family transcriptional regulator
MKITTAEYAAQHNVSVPGARNRLEKMVEQGLARRTKEYVDIPKNNFNNCSGGVRRKTVIVYIIEDTTGV